MMRAFESLVVSLLLVFIFSHSLLSQSIRTEGTLDLQGNRITNVAPPVDSSDAVTKHYVDSLFSDLLDSVYVTFALGYPTSTGIEALLDLGYSIGDLEALGLDTIELVNYGLLDSLYQDSTTYLSLLDAGVSIQELLTAGAKPTELFSIGVTLDSLYGKFYKGGLIFFLDTLDEYEKFNGLVASPIPYWIPHPSYPDSMHPLQRKFGCDGYVTQLEYYNSDMGQGQLRSYQTRIFFLCDEEENIFYNTLDWEFNGYEDWYVPSADELVQVYEKLHAQGYGNYPNTLIWSSDENHSGDTAHSAISIDFDTGEWVGHGKPDHLYFIPVRSFGYWDPVNGNDPP